MFVRLTFVCRPTTGSPRPNRSLRAPVVDPQPLALSAAHAATKLGLNGSARAALCSPHTRVAGAGGSRFWISPGRRLLWPRDSQLGGKIRAGDVVVVPGGVTT
jgi:hypothetical protein